MAQTLSWRTESGTQLLARLGPKQDLSALAIDLLPTGPKHKDVIEFVGEEGCGKTQMLTDIAANCILPKVWKGIKIGGLETSILFIDLDFHFSILRLSTVMESKILNTCTKQGQVTQDMHDEMEDLIQTCLRRLTYIKCFSSHQLLVTLHTLDSLIGKNPGISVIMIDSISAFHWTDKLSGGDSFLAQETNQRKMVQVLQHVVTTYSLVLFVSKPVLYYKKHKNSTGQNAEPHDHMCRQWQQFVSHQFFFRKTDRLQACSGASGPMYVKQFTVQNTGFGQNPEKVFSISECGVTFLCDK